MKKKIWLGIPVILWCALCLFAWFSPAKALSTAERRPLAQMPEISAQALLSGSFMEQFDDFAVDQFPLRDTFRTGKALFSRHVFRQKDNNGIYDTQGHLAKLEPLNTVSINYALGRFQNIYENYLQDTDCKIYAAVIPDKGYYLAAQNGYPAMDYAQLFTVVKEGMPWAETLHLTDCLAIQDYYTTDTHWRQERLVPVAQKLCNAMGVASPAEQDFAPSLASGQFYGVYYGQSALPVAPDDLFVMESETIKNCRVYNYETKAYQPIYDLEKLSGSDPYEVFLSGAQALLTMENPNAHTERELVIFRDSFASSLAPLLTGGYKKVTLVDIRYIHSALLGEYLNFDTQDVLFAYSTTILNNSSTLK